MMAAGLVVSAVGAKQQYDQGKATAQQYEEQAKVAAQGKADVMAQGDRETERELWRTRQALGAQRAATAAAGLDPTFGTPAEIMGETAMFGEMAMQDIRLNAARQAWGYDVEATNAKNNAGMAKWSGKMGAANTMLSGLYSAGSGMYGNSGGGKMAGVRREAIGRPSTKLDMSGVAPIRATTPNFRY